jgi:alkylation response protein AidB-like acyl-CoA dehydrogenase
MPDYHAPLRDIRFVMNEVLNVEKAFADMGYEDCGNDTLDAVLDEAAKFCENVLSPLNQSGDQEGCQWSEEGVKTPAGFRDAYQQFIENGWASISGPTEFGGMGLPNTLAMAVSEMASTANWSWSMYPGLSKGCSNTIFAHGTAEQKSTYLPKLVSGEWTGTMCLTEPHCGSDLGMLRTKAEPRRDGSFAVTGTKIFISAGDHDMSDNIIHIVLARLPDAPKGTKGISLFIVPKFLPNEAGEPGERNSVHCGSIEHKMGIKASATCVMNFDGATGYLIGPENRGLNCMFTFMNMARLGTAMQGLSSTELSYQGALKYAKERLQMRSLSGPKNPAGPADPIIVHPDVRRMLLTQKAFGEGGRMLFYWLALLEDQINNAGSEAERKSLDDLMGFMTPIAKAFMTETSIETTNLGMQIYGGHGYIAEWGMEQVARDARIGTIYEGTTGIQAIDLLARKVLASRGDLLRRFTSLVEAFCKENADNAAVAPYVATLGKMLAKWGEVTMELGMKCMQDPEEAGAASVDYLMYSGYVVFGYMWARMALVAQQAIANGSDEGFYKAKLHTARFYFERLLPRADAHIVSMRSGAGNLMDIDAELFA